MPTAWDSAENLLCVRLDAIGDVLMTTPAIRALRQGHPNRRITLLTSPIGGEIAALIPEIDDIIVYQPPWMKATPERKEPGPEYEMADRLRKRGFDGAVIFTVYSQSPLPAALLAYLARIPRCLAHCHENPYQLISEWVLDPEPHRYVRHEVRRQLDLVAAIGCRTANERLSLRISTDLRETVRGALAEAGLEPARPWVVIHPGATAASRRYPPESYTQVADQLNQQHGWQIVFSGSPGDTPLVERIRREMHAVSLSLSGRLSLQQTAALVEQAPVLIVNNTGPAHIAAATATPVVDLYALTNLQHTPWRVRSRVLFHDLPCRSCYKSICPHGHQDCLRLVRPEQVVEAAVAISRCHEGSAAVAHGGPDIASCAY